MKKAIVFDNAGTLLERCRVVKNIKTGERADNSSLDLIDELGNSALVVIQTDTKKCIMLANGEKKLYDFIKNYNIPLDISYSSSNISKEEILPILKKSNIKLKEFHETAYQLSAENNFIELCSGSAFILNLNTYEVDYVIAAGGKVFPYVSEVIKTLRNRGIHTFIASGDRAKSLYELAEIINIPEENVFETANTKRKREIVAKLQEEGYKVMMVGNGPNDILAFEKADLAVLTLEQNEEVSKKVFDAVDVVIDQICQVLDIEF
ncbi:MAG: HAD family hydrolase [Methanobrevibacter arboriphilus]|jgi:Cu+-exporting ATPase|uniref:Cation transporter n=2 Tax=Methanobrevibacter arboriphilus TaxID=39441 RepID=A0ACA8R4D5_METAZ|nr:HAD family hydrolase [Methanobrevibacter arboriphilus]MBF4468367.1 HAD family hydrolase [Methanobrevibacter arboriphilus]MCC7561301.1 HAD family hydrolase [Methanobrevibacter arboriphilus]BBL62092.1 cation transporter [Methanobrevibacter arboriphilus]GLI11876.1 cation transporter [Methanobrevibacter arboriphilus]